MFFNNFKNLILNFLSNIHLLLIDYVTIENFIKIYFFFNFDKIIIFCSCIIFLIFYFKNIDILSLNLIKLKNISKNFFLFSFFNTSNKNALPTFEKAMENNCFDLEEKFNNDTTIYKNALPTFEKAMKNNYFELQQNFDQLNLQQSINQNIQNNQTLTNQNQTLTNQNQTLTIQNQTLTIQNQTLTIQNQTFDSDIVILQNRIQLLRVENDQLILIQQSLNNQLNVTNFEMKHLIITNNNLISNDTFLNNELKVLQRDIKLICEDNFRLQLENEKLTKKFEQYIQGAKLKVEDILTQKNENIAKLKKTCDLFLEQRNTLSQQVKLMENKIFELNNKLKDVFKQIEYKNEPIQDNTIFEINQFQNQKNQIEFFFNSTEQRLQQKNSPFLSNFYTFKQQYFLPETGCDQKTLIFETICIFLQTF